MGSKEEMDHLNEEEEEQHLTRESVDLLLCVNQRGGKAIVKKLPRSSEFGLRDEGGGEESSEDEDYDDDCDDYVDREQNESDVDEFEEEDDGNLVRDTPYGIYNFKKRLIEQVSLLCVQVFF